jgi:hypothetical protein
VYEAFGQGEILPFNAGVDFRNGIGLLLDELP